MANLSKEELREEIAAELKGVDLNSVSAKKVRQALEDRLDTDLSSRKKEIDDIIMELVNEQGSGGEDESAGEEDEESEEEKKKKKPTPSKRKAARKDSDSEDQASDDDDDYEPKKKARAAPKKRRKDDSDEEDWRAAKKPAAKKGGGKKGGGGGYTKKCKLSPALAKLMGEEHMARHEVIKKMWAIIKEKNLYDPKNKQYAICDDALQPVIGVKRFRTFGMMKYLKDHFINE